MEVAPKPPSLRLPLSLSPYHLLRLLPSTSSSSSPPPPPPPPIPKQRSQTLTLATPRSNLLSNLLASLQSLLPPRGRRPPPPEAAAEAAAEAGCAVPLFRPYVARLPWHGGARAQLSRLFPRYGHYCGPNWSSGKDGGSFLWDRRPLDHLDFCCYCHDMAYDTHDQASLLRADLAFLRCLERSRDAPARDGAAAAAVYRAMCIAGLKAILIPYRTQLVRLQSRPSFVDMFRDLVRKTLSSPDRLAGNQKQRL